MADIQPGTPVTIASDVVANGAVMFAAGEQVTVQQVSPNPERPEYKYVVFSARSNSWFTLSEADFVAQYAPPPAPAAPPQQAFAQPPQVQQQYAPQGGPPYPAPAKQKSNTALKGCLIAFGIVAVLGIIIVVVLFAVIGVGVHHVVTEVEKATKNGTTLPGGVTLSTKVPTEAELGVPIYPGVKMAASSLSLKDQSGSISATVLYSNDSPDKVIAWYKDKLVTKPEYQVLSSTDTEALITFRGDGGTIKMVTIGPDTADKNGQTTIAITSGTDTSRPPGSAPTTTP
jgi:hypothetical protein